MTRRSLFKSVAAAFAGSLLARLPLLGAPVSLTSEPSDSELAAIAFEKGRMFRGFPIFWCDNLETINSQFWYFSRLPASDSWEPER